MGDFDWKLTYILNEAEKDAEKNTSFTQGLSNGCNKADS